MLVLDRATGEWLELLSEHKNSSQISSLSRDKHCHKYLGVLKKTLHEKMKISLLCLGYSFITYIKRKKNSRKKTHIL